MIFAKNFARNYEKKIILGTSDAWSMSHLSQQPSDPAYYIEDFCITISTTFVLLSCTIHRLSIPWIRLC